MVSFMSSLEVFVFCVIGVVVVVFIVIVIVVVSFLFPNLSHLSLFVYE